MEGLIIEKIKEAIAGLDHSYAIVYPGASPEELASANHGLQELGLEGLPTELVSFFEICGGMEFNGMVIYGTFKNQIVDHNSYKHDYYEEFTHLLFFGSIDDDIYTYNTSTNKYESRDINGMECWEEYDTFEDFFMKEMLHWLK